MATIKAVVRKARTDGFYPVYIRLVHRSRMGYIKTGKIVSQKGVAKSGEIIDPVVNEYCARAILRYYDKLNRIDACSLSVSQLIELLTREDDDLCFSDYARFHIRNLINNEQERTAKNYELALNHLELYFGTTKVPFSRMTSSSISLWIKTLEKTHRAKEMYPTCMRQVFRAAVKEYNDYDNGIIRIKTNPWAKVQIPRSDRTTKRAISPEACRKFFSAPLPESNMAQPLPELGHDVAKLVLCLAGINTVDLYNLKKSDYRNGVICYKRAKTRHSRSDEAYFEMRVEPIVEPLFEKYSTPDDDEFLFNFHTRYRSSDSFNANVNNGIKSICKSMGMKREDFYSVYTFRHTWGTVAQNDCRANIAEVGFAMNHTHGYSVTRGYIKIDFSPAWDLNRKVIDFILYSTKKSKQGLADDIDNPINKQFKLSPKRMVYVRAYFKGAVVAELTDMGFGKVEDVLNAVIPQLPDTIPTRAEVTFRVTDVDTQMERVYTRTKGKGL